MARTAQKSPPGRPHAAGCLFLAVVLVAALGIGAVLLLQRGSISSPIPESERCVATAGDASVAVDVDQAHLTSIIVGLSVKRGLAPRAASIAMATVYQETGIRNLDYGDRDSVGLFQQRPSQGWGSVEELMDPYYATNAFYDALVKIDGWESGDINDVAQKVQVSGYPEAYRDHESDARVLASTLTGQTPAGFSCLDRTDTDGDAKALTSALKKTFGSVDVTRDGKVVSIKAKSTKLAWAYGQFAVANTAEYGVVTVQSAGQTWQSDPKSLPTWSTATPAADQKGVTITVR